MTYFLASCIRANEEIFQALSIPFSDSFLEMRGVGAGGDEISGLDAYAESVFVKHLAEYGQIESEESGSMGEYRTTKIVIDPIDGSSNALSYIPYFGTSVARVIDGVVDVAVVCNMANGEMFFKDKDGAVMEGKVFRDRTDPIIVSSTPKVGIFEKSYNHPHLTKALMDNNLKFRSMGAVALSLAYAHRVDYMLFMGSPRKYDVVAGLALCEDLERIVTDDYVIVSRTKEIAHTIERLIKSTQTKEIE